ncbi:hypothetical protein DL95DRAFT_529574 [Leptodontidium sp. 2 PMI_412]|nr:hypothetical protein DL95DRAFT_529574 [Leptodontidium sp. 2 PMI_412]
MAKPPPKGNEKSSDDFPYIWVCCKCDKFNGTDKYFRNNESCSTCKHPSCAQCIDTEPTKPKAVCYNWICCKCFELKDAKNDSRESCGKCEHEGCDQCFDAE